MKGRATQLLMSSVRASWGEEALVRLQAVVKGAVGGEIGCGELAVICSGP